MPYDPEPQIAPPNAARPSARIDAVQLLGLVQRTCQALQAMVSSLEALDRVLLRLQRMEPSASPTALLSGTRDTVARVVALLRREGPPLLLRAQALRLRLRLPDGAGGSSAAVAMRMLHADLDALAAFRSDDAAHWGFIIRRLRTHAMVLLAEFDGERRRLSPGQDQAAPPPRDLPAHMAVAR